MMRIELKTLMGRFAIPLLSLFIGLGCALAIAALAGESPLVVMGVLYQGAFGSLTQVGYSLFYATPLIFTGLSVAWAFRAGLFNIGAEGQMALGGLAMSAVGILAPHWPAYLAIPFSLAIAFFFGGLWGGFAGWLKAKRGCHEVLTTILLNFIAYGLVSFMILSVFDNPDSQVPETAEIGPGFYLSPLPALGGGSPLNTSLFLALAAAAFYGFVFRRTKFGFLQRMTGGAPAVGLRAGVDIDRETVKAMFISGGLAALAGAGLILGFAHKTREGFTGGLGFVGIAVALLGRNTALGVVVAAVLFGILTKGALDLDLDTENVTRELAVVIQALIVLAVASQQGWLDLLQKLRRPRHG
ncbi:MAG: ABC transporter permease [Bdellovibrionaceae bacterium]|nr:ABC transporter permease [Pseudobdellovibrionaceae bacterium]